MFRGRKTLFILTFLPLIFVFGAPLSASAKGGEADAIVRHLRTKYQAKKVNIPLMWLARFAVKVARPAGVQSFGVTMFENLRFPAPAAALDGEMQAAMRNSLGAQWSPLLRVRSRAGGQIYMYMREAGKSVKIMLVTIDKNQAVVVRAQLSPEKLVEFINNPKIFGIRLGDAERQANKDLVIKQDDSALEKKPEDSPKNP